MSLRSISKLSGAASSCALQFLLLFFFWGGGGGDGRLFKAGRLLTFPTYSVGAYSRWALIRGWALNRINTVTYKKCHCFQLKASSTLLRVNQKCHE